jgi:hypothetical protein
VDGFQFNPLETRNGLYLNGNLNNEAKENRKIIEHAIENSIEFTNWLLSENIDKRYLLAKTNIPEPPQKYDSIAIEWFIQQQKKWREKLREFRLLKNKNGNYNKLRTLKLPIFKDKFNSDFFELIDELNITNGIIPVKEEAKIWYDIIKTDPLKEVYEINEDTWNFDYTFSEDNLLQKINDLNSIRSLASEMNVETNTIINWLNKLYSFLKDNNCMDFFYKYSIIPNRNGVFKNIIEIYSNNEANFNPEIFNNLYGKLFGKELNDILIHKDIKIDNLKKKIEKKNFEDILKEFSNIFDGNNNENKEYLCNELISLATNDNNSIIKKMFDIRKETDNK